jgi:hypothetical protein
MSAARTFRRFACAFSVLVALTATAASAHAHRIGVVHPHRHYHVQSPTIVYRPALSTRRFVVRPLVVPVSYYDSLGRRYIVWQTNYFTAPTLYLR